MAGVRQILSPARSSTMATSEYGYSGGAAEEFEGAPAATQDSAAGASKSAPEVGAAPSYITVGTLVYRLTGEATGVDATTLSTIGATSSSLGATQVSAHDVLGGPDRVRRLREGRRGHAVRVRAGTRTFSARQYALSGGSITAYGTWPTLPSGVETPTNPDGSPQYVEAGTDSGGVTVYRPVGGDAATGIAVAPGTAPSDPAAGNPNWTWWVPVAE